MPSLTTHDEKSILHCPPGPKDYNIAASTQKTEQLYLLVSQIHFALIKGHQNFTHEIHNSVSD